MGFDTNNIRFGIVDVPEPRNLKAKFVYNFFVPDERTNASGDSRVQGRTISGAAGEFQFENEPTVLDARVPRYVLLEWTPGYVVNYKQNQLVYTPAGIEAATTSKIKKEVSISTNRFISTTTSDPDGPDRIAAKLHALSSLENISFEDTDQTKKLAEIIGDGITKNTLQPLISPKQSSMIVNFKTNVVKKDKYDMSRNFSVNAQISLDAADEIYGSVDDMTPLSASSIRAAVKDLVADWKSTHPKTVLEADRQIKLTPWSSSTKTEINLDANPGRILAIKLVGFYIEKSKYDPMGNVVNHEIIWPISPDSKTFVDTKVTYGTKYSYKIRNVYSIRAEVGQQMSMTMYEIKNVSLYIASKPTGTKTVSTTEAIAPSPPDGLFYKFDYSKGTGLCLTWQIPVGKSRDVKYFQVFKRASIMSEFFCIGMLDFDDSEVKVIKPEFVRHDLVIKTGRTLPDGTFKVSGPQTYFRDNEFDRDSGSAIYAVCAVDAHGLTSGYSAQTQVTFNKTKNAIDLKSISRAGAPKQYPNFFVDPSLDDSVLIDSFSQDAIFDSGHSKVKIYFTPDMTHAVDHDQQIESVVATDKLNGKYKIHIINLDLQKSTNAELVINDKR